jgi:hypothetical protein
MEKPSLDFLPYSTESRSMSRDANPDPVPPPKEWNTRNPCVLSGVGRSKNTKLLDVVFLAIFFL